MHEVVIPYLSSHEMPAFARPLERRMKASWTKAVAALGLIAAGASMAQAETNRVAFPADIDQLVHYATVRRGPSTERIMTTKEALAAMKAGNPAPDGTQFVLLDIRDGKPYRYFVMQKGVGFGAEYDERRRTGDWQFQWYWPDRSVNLQENTARCQSCHQGRATNEFLFTFDQLKAFVGQPVE